MKLAPHIFITRLRAIAAASLLPLALLSLAASTQPADPSVDLQAQYQDVLTQMKKPAASGVLVTEIGPLSAAGRSGLRAGDIILKYAGRDARTLEALRNSVADTLADREVADNKNKLLLEVRRHHNDQIFQLPREPLGIRALEVEIGIPATPNPAPPLRGTVTLTWNLDHFADSQTHWFRLYENQDYVGYQSVKTTSFGNDRVAVEITSTRVEVLPPDAPDTAKTKTLSTTTESLSFHPGDYTTSPPLNLTSLAFTDNSRGAEFSSSAQRLGGKLQGFITAEKDDVPSARSVAAPLTTISPAGIPLLAAALPLEKNHVLPLHLLSPWDLLPHPGYVLISRGKQKIEDRPAAEQLFRVDLMHAGIILESYWLSENRQLLRTELLSGSKREALHVGSQTDAQATSLPTPTPKK